MKKKMPRTTRFWGSPMLYKYGNKNHVLYTEGVRFVAKKLDAFWLIRAIGACLKEQPQLKDAELLAWRLSITGRTATLCCDGDDTLISKTFDFDDFPEIEDFPNEGIELWFERGVLMLIEEWSDGDEPNLFQKCLDRLGITIPRLE